MAVNHSIFVIDTSGSTGQQCKCGKKAMFIVGIYDKNHHLCENCIAELAKRIIDGLT